MAKHLAKSKIPAFLKKASIPIAMAGVMLATSGSAYAAPEAKQNTVQTSPQLEVSKVADVIASLPTTQPAVVASPEAKVSFEKSAVTTVANPERVEAERIAVLEAKAAEEKKVADAEAAKKAEEAKVAAAAQAAQTASQQSNAPAASKGAGTATAGYTGAAVSAAASNGSIGQRIAAAARAQIGVNQDCTMLVTNSLKAVGINFHDWPAGYMSLGTIVTNPEPGDLIYYANGGSGMAHIAVYSGNGPKGPMAIHGGFNGNQTVEFSANVGSGPVYIRVAG